MSVKGQLAVIVFEDANLTKTCDLQKGPQTC